MKTEAVKNKGFCIFHLDNTTVMMSGLMNYFIIMC